MISGFPGGSVVKNPTMHHSNTRAWRIPRTEEPGYRPWDHKELDTTVQLTFTFGYYKNF